jgi:PAS domain S-box-containing protein
VTADDGVLEETAEELFEDAPCGYVSSRPDGTIVRVNRTFEALTGLRRDDLVGTRRFQDLLSPGGRIYHETHYAPLLRMQGSVGGIAVEFVCADGSRLPALISSSLVTGEGGAPRSVRTTVFDATDRRAYEEELLRARQREQQIALQLQRSLLTGELPSGAGLEVEVAYHPADSGVEVGGDWYDAFWLEQEAVVALVVGDVVGRGIGAATTMGQLRSAVRALASTGLGPARLLQALDVYSRRYGVGQSATVVYLELDLASGAMRYACAGHPPPVIVAPGAAPRFAWEGRSVPLDAQHDEPEPRDEAELELPPGGSVLLYTDGLIETRGRSLTVGMDRLLEQVAAHEGEPPGVLAAAVMDAVRTDEQADDHCLLVARRGG